MKKRHSGYQRIKKMQKKRTLKVIQNYRMKYLKRMNFHLRFQTHGKADIPVVQEENLELLITILWMKIFLIVMVFSCI